MEVVLKTPFAPTGCAAHPGPADISYILAKVRAYSTNALIARSVPIAIGDPVVGVLTAAYNGSSRAILDVWRPVVPSDWALLSHETFAASNKTDFEDWAVGWLPILGGYPFSEDAPGENRISGARISPPKEGPFIFHRERRARINEADKAPAPAQDPQRMPLVVMRYAETLAYGLEGMTGRTSGPALPRGNEPRGCTDELLCRWLQNVKKKIIRKRPIKTWSTCDDRMVPESDENEI